MKLIATLVAISVVICVIAYLSNRAFMYFPDPTRVAPSKAGLVDVDEVELEAGDAVTLVAWYTAANKNKSTILYFHGNGANAAERASRIATMREDGFGVFYLNNRGYGGSEGRPTEQNNVADAVAAYDHLRSLGVPKRKLSLTVSLWDQGSRSASLLKDLLLPSCWSRLSHRRSMWREAPTSGYRSSGSSQIPITTRTTFAP